MPTQTALARKRDYKEDLNSREKQKDIQMYLDDIAEFPVLTYSQVIELGRKIRQGDLEAREELIKCNLKLVVKIAKEFQGRGFTLMELVAEGNIGLIKSVEKYDHERGNRFSTYATWWIKQYIRRILPKRSIVHIPAYLIDIISKLRKTERNYIENKGYEPLLEELLPNEEPQKIRMINIGRKVLERNGVHDDMSVSNMPSNIPDNEDIDTDVYQKVQRILKTCTEREQMIMELRSRGYTLERVGKMIGLTRERVRQIETGTINYIRGVFRIPPKKTIYHASPVMTAEQNK